MLAAQLMEEIQADRCSSGIEVLNQQWNSNRIEETAEIAQQVALWKVEEPGHRDGNRRDTGAFQVAGRLGNIRSRAMVHLADNGKSSI